MTEQTRDRAIDLRRRATDAEKVLWALLRNRQLGGLKFRRQHPIEPYIVDFYCASCHLVVELDGESHDERQEYDAKRDLFLRDLGLKIMRISIEDIRDNIDGVAELIYRASAAKSPSPNPSPADRRGGLE